MKNTAISFFLFLVFLFVFFASGAIESQDGFLYTAVARNLYYTGAPTAPFYDWSKPARENKNIPMNVYQGEDGKTYTRTGIGFSIFLLPAVVITDFVYRIYGINPPVNFPLESDWLILMLASFTNSVLAAALGVVVFLYLMTLGLSKKSAIFLSLAMLLCTNLFILSKSTMAHIMFALFLVLTFYLIKLFSIQKKRYLLFLAGVSFGLTVISYNMTFVLAIPALILYYFLLIRNRKHLLKNILIAFLGTLPFMLIFIWYEITRQEAGMAFGGRDARDVFRNFTDIPIGILIEGIHGHLFSPGRSIFLYSPILMVPFLLWHKVKKTFFPEFLVFILLFLIYLFFYAIQYQVIKPEYGLTGFWHGEVSWGPRYLSVLIPFGMLMAGVIYKNISPKLRLLIFLPLLLIGFYIQMLAVVIPYQTKFRGLEQNFFVNETYYPVEIYSNFLPRYSPVLVMTKNVYHLALDFPKTINHGIYNLKFVDGIDFPFSVGNERWRTVEGHGHIIFDNNNDPITSFSIGLINHPNVVSSSSAQVKLVLNGDTVSEVNLKPSKRQVIKIQGERVFQKSNRLEVVSSFEPGIKLNDQILVINSFKINDKPQNLESLDYPFVSGFGKNLGGIEYQNFGGSNKNPWRFWDLHTQIYERTPDFWWIKPLFYWDFPKGLFALLFFINFLGLGFFGYQLLKSLNNK